MESVTRSTWRSGGHALPHNTGDDVRVSASTQNQAASALLFLYTRVLNRHIDWGDRIVRAQRPERLPVVLTRAEVTLVLRALHGTAWLTASLMYGPASGSWNASNCVSRMSISSDRSSAFETGRGRRIA